MPQKSTVVDQLMSLNEKDLKKENVSTKITCLKVALSQKAGNALARVQRVQAPADLWDITFCTR